MKRILTGIRHTVDLLGAVGFCFLLVFAAAVAAGIAGTIHSWLVKR